MSPDLLARCVRRALCLVLFWLPLAGLANTEDSAAEAAVDSSAEVEAAAQEEPLSEEERQFQAEVEALLTQDPQRADYVEDVRCIYSRRIRSVEVLDDKHVAFRMGRDKYYLVQFKHRCPGLRKEKPVMYESDQARLCKHDSIRAVYDMGLGNYRPGMKCGIPGFQSVTKEQIVHLKDLLKAKRKGSA